MADITTEVKKYFLMHHINSVNDETKKAVGRVIIDAGQKRLVSCAEGTVINLNALSSDIIDKMYAILSMINKERIAEGLRPW